MEPLPNCFSIWESANSTAFARSSTTAMAMLLRMIARLARPLNLATKTRGGLLQIRWDCSRAGRQIIEKLAKKKRKSTDKRTRRPIR
jgi:hypothetical protein